MKKPIKYDFNKPIKIIGYRKNRFDIIFYSFILSLLMMLILFLLFLHNGKFEINFVFWRVLLSIPLIILAYLFKQLLEELRKYPKLLMKKNIWNLKELMELTGKNEKETKDIITRVLESCFVVDKKNIIDE